jgi:hypothetical protein
MLAGNVLLMCLLHWPIKKQVLRLQQKQIASFVEVALMESDPGGTQPSDCVDGSEKPPPPRVTQGAACLFEIFTENW